MAAGQRLRLEDYTVGSLPTLIYIPNFITESEQSHLLQRIYGAPSLKWKSLKNRRLQNWGGVVHEKGLLPQDLPPWLTKITQRICQETGLFPSAINHVLINEYLPDQGIMPHQDGPAYFPVVAILSLGSPAVIDFTPHTRLKDCKDVQVNTPGHMTDGEAAAEAYSSDLSDEIVCMSEDAQHHRALLLMPCSLLIFKDQAYSEYLHGIKDSELHDLDKVVNVSEYLKQDTNSACSLDGAVESDNIFQMKKLHRTSPRVSLTCRLVLKVHKNLFKF